MRGPELLILDIVQAADRIASYIEGLDRAGFLADRKTQATCIREIEVFGEASARLPADFRTQHANVPWSNLVLLSNPYIHAYERVRYERVWRTVTSAIPHAAREIAQPAPQQTQERHDA